MQNNENSFFSLDRLLEFGMGMAMSHQIIQNMNTLMASMQRPPQMPVVASPLYAQVPIQSDNPPQVVYQNFAQHQEKSSHPASFSEISQSSTKQSQESLPPITIPEIYYIASTEKKPEGPYSGTEFARLVLEKKVSASTLVWKSGTADWKKASEFPELIALIALVPPPKD